MKTVIPIAALAAALVLLTGPGAYADSKEPRPEPPPTPRPAGAPQFHARTTGQVVIGEAAPDFVLDASNGKPLKLSDLRGHWVLLTFADRKESVEPFRDVVPALDSADVHLVTVCAEKSYVLEQYAKREKVPFLMLADFSREISEMYGVYDNLASKVMPGYLLITPRGDVALTVLGQEIPAPEVSQLAIYVAGVK